MPAGKLSLTVVVPVLLDGPLFETVMVYWPLPPAVKVAEAVFVIARSKLAEMLSVSVAVLLAGVVSSEWLIVAVFAMVPVAATLIVLPSAYFVLLQFIRPFLARDLKPFIQWTFIVGTIATAIWFAWALFTNSDAVITAMGRSASKVRPTSPGPATS